MVDELSVKFPLTYKYRFLIIKLANLNRFSIDEGRQEALILEWEVQQKITDPEYKENYFRQVLYRRLYAIKNNWWSKHKIQFPLDEESGEPIPSEDVLDQLIQVRPFDGIFYEHLVQHIVQMLAQIDQVAMEMFLCRIKEAWEWKKIKDSFYNDMPHNQYYDRVKVIKKIVKVELCKV